MDQERSDENVRISFDSENQEVAPTAKGLKLDPAKSRFKKKSEERASFHEQAEAIHKKMEGYQLRAIELGKSFIKMLRDKTLPDNKGPLELSLEREVIDKLIGFAIDVNNDQHEKEGMGSVGLITLLLNSLLKVRDNYNKLEYRLSLMEKKLSSLEEKNKDNGEG